MRENRSRGGNLRVILEGAKDNLTNTQVELKSMM
jgi:hypothetical protein